MKKLGEYIERFGLWLMLFSLTALAQSQHIEVSKNVGQPVIIDFWGLPADLATFDGLTLEAAAAIGGPYSDVVTSVQKADRSITFPAPAAPTFYRLYWFKTVNGVKQKSASSNAIAVFIVNTGLPMP